MQSQKEGTIYFNIVFHHHQPVGNLLWIIEGLRITFGDSVSCGVFPLYSFPKSGIGYENLYQGTFIFPKIKAKGKKVRFKVTLFLDKALDDYESIIRRNIIPSKKIIPDP